MPRYPAQVKRPVLQYACLSALLVVAVAYQARFTAAAHLFPKVFHQGEVVEWPFRLMALNPSEPFRMDFLSNAAVKAGIHRGGVLVAVNGRAVTGTAIYGAALARARVGDTLRITFRQKPGETPAEKTVGVVLQKSNQGGLIAVTLLFAMPVFCIALGFWVAFVRPRDPLAWLLMALLLSFAVQPAPNTELWEPGWRDAATIYRTFLASTLGIWMMLFGIYFPEPFPAGVGWRWWDWAKWAVGVPLALAAAAEAAMAVGLVENYAAIAPLAHVFVPLQRPFEVYGFGAVATFFACIGTKYHMAVSQDAKRRLRFLYVGAIVCFTPLLILIVVALLRRAEIEESFPWWAFLTAYGLISLFPVLLAYLIIVRRAMDVRILLRMGSKYLLARTTLTMVRVAGIAALVWFLAIPLFSHRHSPQTSIFWGAVLALFGFLFLRKKSLTDVTRRWLDRKFFREAYDAEQILSDLGDQVRSIVETRPLLATVAERIAESLHVGRVAVLIDGSEAYRPAYAVGYARTPEVAFPDSAGVVQQLRREREPAKVYLDDPDSWLYRAPGLTDEERSQLTALEAELLLPLSVKDKLLGFISLGQKRSEEPYSGADLRLLKSVAAQTGLALENARLTSAIAEEAAQRERLNREVEIAREVQERLFPQKLPEIPGLDYCGKCRPALGVGGDYYDFLALPGGRLGVALGDVSGKGIAAALMMASLQASLRAEAMRDTDDLASLIQNINRLVYDATAENRYATFFFARYDPGARRLSYVNAGHNPPMLFRKCRGAWKVSRLEAGGTVIGLLEDFSYRESTVTLEPDDLLVVYTDGITETMNPQEEEWGEDALVETIQACDGLPSQAVISRVMSAADQFASGASQHDDMTLVVMRLGSSPDPPSLPNRA